VKWKSFVESQIITYIAKLEYYAEQYLGDYLELHPYTESYEKEDPDFEYCSAYYFGIAVARQSGIKEIDLRHATIEFMEKLKLKKSEIGESNNVKVYQITRDELPDCIFKDGRPAWAEKMRRRNTSFSNTVSEEDSQSRRKVHPNPEKESDNINMYARHTPTEINFGEVPVNNGAFENGKPQPVHAHDGVGVNILSPHINGNGFPKTLGENNTGNGELKSILSNIKGMKTNDLRRKELPKIVEERKKIVDIIDENKNYPSNKDQVADALDEFLI